MLCGNLMSMLILRFSIPHCIAKLTNRLTSYWLHAGEELHLKRNERVGSVMFREIIAVLTDSRKEAISLKVSISKSREGTNSHSDFHLFHRILVAAACLVGRKERMWHNTEFGKVLILSSKRVRTKSHSDFHLFERILVAAACLVGRKETM